GAVVLLLCSSYLRWYLPGFGRLYRMHVQSRVLRMLAALLAVDKPLPQAVGVLVDTDYGSAVVRRRLRAVRRRLEQGDPLAAPPRRHGLLPRSMVPLVQSAERLGNLPWALAELGEARGNRLVRVLRTGSSLLSPAVILAVGTMVGFIVVGMFLPL